ncbi:MAG TPA: hypothetical protein EYG38_01945 [Verrucomicrobia bacterium]|nr:hypothetical protein [Verrucomicrobiota bacterium]
MKTETPLDFLRLAQTHHRLKSVVFLLGDIAGTMGEKNFSEFRKSEVIEKTLRHCGLWGEDPARVAPPSEELVEEKKESEERCPNRILKNVHGLQKAGALSSFN